MPPPDLHFRRATVEDAEALAALHAEALPPGWPVSDFAKYAQSEVAEIWCAYRGADFIGLCVAQVLPPEAEILTVGVVENARRSGVGSALLSHAIDALEEKQVNRIFLDVAESNRPAQRLYGKLGFTLFARRKSYYQMDGMLEDAVVMLRERQICRRHGRS